MAQVVYKPDSQVAAEWSDLDTVLEASLLSAVSPWTLEFVGQGNGPTKTTTVLDGPTIAEEFQIGDRIYTHWGVPDFLDRTKDLRLRVHFYLNQTDAGTLISWQVAVGDSNGDRVDVIRQTITVADTATNAAFIDAHTDFLIDAATVNLAAADSLHVRVERIASSNDPAQAQPRVHLVQLTQV